MTATVPSKIQKLRDQIAGLKEQIDALAAGHVPVARAEADRRLAAWLADDDALRWARLRVREAAEALAEPEPRQYPNPIGTTPEDVIGFLRLAATDLIRTVMVDALDRHYATAPEPLAAEQQQQRLAELREQLLDLEVQEHAAVEQAQRQGITVDFRPDTDPAVLLGLVA